MSRLSAARAGQTVIRGRRTRGRPAVCCPRLDWPRLLVLPSSTRCRVCGITPQHRGAHACLASCLVPHRVLLEDYTFDRSCQHTTPHRGDNRPSLAHVQQRMHTSWVRICAFCSYTRLHCILHSRRVSLWQHLCAQPMPLVQGCWAVSCESRHSHFSGQSDVACGPSWAFFTNVARKRVFTTRVTAATRAKATAQHTSTAAEQHKNKGHTHPG